MGGVGPGERREWSGSIIENNKSKTQSKYFTINKTSRDIGILKPHHLNTTEQQTKKIFTNDSHSVKTDYFRHFAQCAKGSNNKKREETVIRERRAKPRRGRQTKQS